MKPYFLLACFTAVTMPAAFADEWQPTRLSWGDPDLQGTWTSATVTTLERPE